MQPSYIFIPLPNKDKWVIYKHRHIRKIITWIQPLYKALTLQALTRLFFFKCQHTNTNYFCIQRSVQHVHNGHNALSTLSDTFICYYLWLTLTPEKTWNSSILPITSRSCICVICYICSVKDITESKALDHICGLDI